jgi:CRP/FNR family transcriptional regulator, polysaccharide utilization system transcription regulator
MHPNPRVCCEKFIDRGNSVFSVLSEKEKEAVKKNMRIGIYRKNDIIFKAGDEPKGLVCLADGEAKIYKEGIGGRDQIIRMAKTAGFIGYRALFAEEEHNSSALAITDTVAFSISKEHVMKLLKTNPDFAFNIIKAFATELGTLYNRTVTLTQKHIRGRLAESLLFLKDTYGYESDEKTIKIYLSREDLANLSNMTTSNAIRTLSAFAQEEVISLKGRKILVEDLHKLEKISEMG